jgi:hypothetical protein
MPRPAARMRAGFRQVSQAPPCRNFPPGWDRWLADLAEWQRSAGIPSWRIMQSAPAKPAARQWVLWGIRRPPTRQRQVGPPEALQRDHPMLILSAGNRLPTHRCREDGSVNVTRSVTLKV